MIIIPKIPLKNQIHLQNSFKNLQNNLQVPSMHRHENAIEANAENLTANLFKAYFSSPIISLLQSPALCKSLKLKDKL